MSSNHKSKFKPGDLVLWRYVDYDYPGIIVSVLPKIILTRKYLTFWIRDASILECFEDDIELASRGEY